MNSTVMKCQNCQCPIEIDISLLDMSIVQRDMISGSAAELVKNSVYKVPDGRLSCLKQVKKASELTIQPLSGPSESYVFLNTNESILQPSRMLDDEVTEDEEDDNSKTLSSNIQNLSRIFRILSSKSNIDYPVCQICCELLIQKLQTEYDDAVRHRDSYYEFMQRLEKQKEKENNVEAKRSRSVFEHAAERDELLAQLASLEEENEKLDQEIKELQVQLQQKKESETREIVKQNLKDLDQISFMKDSQSLRNQYELTMNNLDKLRKTNIYNETFRISHNGPFGTINGLRLGGFNQVRVPWQEINAAMGQLILLLATIANKIGYELDNFKLRPLGSYSKIEQYDASEQKWVVYNAFNTNEFNIAKFFHKETSFDKSLECILAIVKQIASKISAFSKDQEDEVDLPYPMQHDKINNLPIKLMGSEPTLEWTTSCKFLLTNSKWLLAFSSQVM